jgi:protein-tyrosine phosphatase
VPVMSEGLAVAEKLLGREEALQLVTGRPGALMRDLPPSQVAPLPTPIAPRGGGWRDLLHRWRNR